MHAGFCKLFLLSAPKNHHPIFSVDFVINIITHFDQRQPSPLLLAIHSPAKLQAIAWLRLLPFSLYSVLTSSIV